MTAETDLLPCPFCGTAPVVRVPQITDGYAVHIRCRCGVEMYGSRSHFGTGDEAIAAWNRRACVSSATEALRAEVERLTNFNADTCEGFNRLSVERTVLITRAERLAEALRKIETKLVHSMDHARSSLERKRAMSECADSARAALEQEGEGCAS